MQFTPRIYFFITPTLNQFFARSRIDKKNK